MTSPRRAADTHDVIEVRGARENNLTGVDLDIPKRRLTVFTGVSGSGKSSLVFGTIAAESQRLINETYSAFLQSFMPSLSRPVVDQERMGANSRSTVGTATDAYAMLRIAFSRLGEPHVGTSGAFSFNLPEGMCPACEGLGRVSDLDVHALLDFDRSLHDGAIQVPGFTPDSWYVQTYLSCGFFDPGVPIRDFTPEQLDDLLHKGPCKVKVGKTNITYEGLAVKVRRLYLQKDTESLQPRLRAFIEKAAACKDCGACGGARLNQAALSAKIDGKNIADCAAKQISDLADFVRSLDAPSIRPLLGNLRATLDSLVEIGLGYLSLDRESA